MAAERMKLLVVGDKLCGKTCLIHVLSGGEFPPYMRHRMASIYSLDVEVDGRQVEFDPWERCGEYDWIQAHYYLKTNIILMCFSVDDPESLENIPKKWVPEVKNVCPNVPIILVANKKDLRNDEHVCNELARRNQEPVLTEQGQDMATSFSAYKYLECSAKTGEGLREVLKTAARAALQKQPGQSKEPKNCCKLL